MNSSHRPRCDAHAYRRRVLSSLAGSPKFGTIRGIKFRTLVSRIGPRVSFLGLSRFLIKPKQFITLTRIWIAQKPTSSELARTCNI